MCDARSQRADGRQFFILLHLGFEQALFGHIFYKIKMKIFFDFFVKIPGFIKIINPTFEYQLADYARIAIAVAGNKFTEFGGCQIQLLGNVRVLQCKFIVTLHNRQTERQLFNQAF